MELQHRFTVPAGVEETWAHFTDIAGVAECFPGATVTEADAESFTGTVKVKLGPIALVYHGAGTFREVDEAARRMVIEAKGKDKRGNGTAGATVTATMSEAGAGATEVAVTTDLAITGKAAQFGRGNVISDVSDKLLGQFVSCLEERLGSATESSAPADPEPSPAPVSPASPAAPAAPEAAAQAPPEQGSAPTSPAGDPTSTTGPATPPRPSPREDDEALDLGAAVLPVLLKAYWKPAAAILALLALLLWWIARD